MSHDDTKKPSTTTPSSVQHNNNTQEVVSDDSCTWDELDDIDLDADPADWPAELTPTILDLRATRDAQRALVAREAAIKAERVRFLGVYWSGFDQSRRAQAFQCTLQTMQDRLDRASAWCEHRQIRPMVAATMGVYAMGCMVGAIFYFRHFTLFAF